MVKNFKGEVKISDVQTEFDNIVDRINNMVEAYNISGKVEDIDYSVGGVNLSPAGYTLSVGGLKQGLAAVAGNVIGAKCFKITKRKFKITAGLIITEKGSVRLPDKVIDYDQDYNALYFNTDTQDYQWLRDKGNPNVYKICDININRDNRFISDFRSVQTENFNGHYKITSQTKAYSTSWGNWDSDLPPNTDKPYFFSAQEAEKTQGQGTGSLLMFGETVAYNRQTGSRNLDYWVNCNKLFLPKGVNWDSIYKLSNAGNGSRYFNVIIDKKVE